MTDKDKALIAQAAIINDIEDAHLLLTKTESKEAYDMINRRISHLYMEKASSGII